MLLEYLQISKLMTIFKTKKAFSCNLRMPKEGIYGQITIAGKAGTTPAGGPDRTAGKGKRKFFFKCMEKKFFFPKKLLTYDKKQVIIW